jgi:Matrixin
MRSRSAFVLAVLIPVAACSKSPTDPSGQPVDTMLRGQTVNAIDGAAAPNLSVRVGNQAVTSDGSGNFQLDLGSTGASRVVIRGNGVVERETRVNGPSSNARLSLIPSSFDLGAFDEMFRALNSRLSRWTSRPALVVLGTVMDYRGTGETYEATSELLTDDELNTMLAHLNEGLALLTGNTYQTFASVEIERPAAGTRVSPFRNGTIVVGRYKGISTFARTIGWGHWGEAADGSIVLGATFLDRDFDREDSRRRLLRIHELGHALGYQHVTTRTSIMNPAIGPEPMEFDRAGALIAFQRPVGNQSPDVDPTSAAVLSSTGAVRISPPTVCK